VATVRPRVGFIQRADLERARDLARDADELTRRLYKTARWQRLRLFVLSRDLYTCRLCRRIEGNSSLLVCDHIEPHRGDVERFWAGPFQTLCKACHDGEKQRLERAARR
jgi:5-methylcytosine-specific restriction protein A